jgi:cysteine desulfurase / selenocysteine lyase
LVDACQAVGQMPVDVDELGCDALSATGRKFVRGPRGTGLLYVRSSLLERLEPARLDLRAAEWAAPDRYELRRDGRRFEEWEQYDAGKIGLARAIDYVLAWELPAIWERVRSGGERLRELLRGVEGVTIQDPGVVRRGIVTFTVAGIPAEQVKEALAREQITVSVALAGHAVIDASCRMSSRVRALLQQRRGAQADRGCGRRRRAARQGRRVSETRARR